MEKNKIKAIIMEKGGPPEVLQVLEVEKPTPKSNEILIKIFATTVTFGDAMMRKLGFVFSFLFWFFIRIKEGKISRKRWLGHELAGEIEAVGEDVRKFQKGDQVFATLGMAGGSYAQYICLPEDGLIALKPTNMSYEEAAAVPVGGLTALHFMKTANIQSGYKVLIYGASGSVGTYALQLAKYYGAEVTGVSSTANLDLLKSIGADAVLDYTKDVIFAQNDQKYDIIFDAVRKISKGQCKSLLKKNGVFLSVSSSISESVEGLLFLKNLIEEGKIKAVIDRRFPLEEIADAHRYVDAGHKKGNVVITLDHLH